MCVNEGRTEPGRGALQTMMTSTSTTADREIVTTRLIDAPRTLVFEAWTDPQHVTHWFGPRL